MNILMDDDPTIGLLETLERFNLIKVYFGVAMWEPTSRKQYIIVCIDRISNDDNNKE